MSKINELEQPDECLTNITDEMVEAALDCWYGPDAFAYSDADYFDMRSALNAALSLFVLQRR
jgi:hypothetical protein